MKLYLDIFTAHSNFVLLVAKECEISCDTIFKDQYFSQSRKVNNEIYLPALHLNDQVIVNEPLAIVNFFAEEARCSDILIGENNIISCQSRSYAHWFTYRFYSDVTKPMMEQKIPVNTSLPPNSRILQIAKKNLREHLKYLSNILQATYLCGEKISIADYAIASQLVIIDYFNEIIWEAYPEIKFWYSLIKSRPSFASFLQTRLKLLTPPSHFSKIDF